MIFDNELHKSSSRSNGLSMRLVCLNVNVECVYIIKVVSLAYYLPMWIKEILKSQLHLLADYGNTTMMIEGSVKLKQI